MTDASALALLPMRHQLAPATLPLPEASIFEAVADKAALLATAVGLGLDVPRQVLCESRGSRVSVESEGFRYPLVLKPTRSVAGLNGQRRKLAVRHVPDARALDQALTELADEAFPCLLQERIVGPGLGVFLLLWNGTVMARFAHRRLREKPPAGGVSVRAESVALDPDMEHQAETLLRHYDWQGVAMVEFKHDLATGRNCLMEVNGRFWGSLQLAIDSGVNFPALLVSAAAGLPVEPVISYRTGVRTRWWWGEVDHFVTRLRRSSYALGLAPEPPPPSLFRVAMDILSAPLRGVRGEVLRFADPAPGLRETVQWVRRR
jgi:predicted ATP-grasp superfamily ATP-dependent carboligase